MKRGQKHAPQPKPAPAAPAPAIPPHIAALGIVKSVRPDSSYECIHDQELTECDECAPLALLADEDASGQAPADAACPRCGQIDVGQTGEHPCATCGLPALHDEPPAPAAPDAPPVVAFASDRTVFRAAGALDGEIASMPEDLSVACAALGLASAHVLTHAIRGDGSVSIVTRGGARLRWPCSEDQRQDALALTDQQRDGLIRDSEGNILPRGKWLTTPHKF